MLSNWYDAIAIHSPPQRPLEELPLRSCWPRMLQTSLVRSQRRRLIAIVIILPNNDNYIRRFGVTYLT